MSKESMWIQLRSKLFSKVAILVTYKKSITTEDTTKIFFERVWVHFWIMSTIISYQDNMILSTF